MTNEKTGKRIQTVNAENLRLEDITSHAAFRVAGVEGMNSCEQMCAKVELRKAARKLGLSASEFEQVWEDYMESSKSHGAKACKGLSADASEVYGKLKLRENGMPSATTDNFVTIMMEDTNLKDRILYNEFAQRIERSGDVPWSTGRDGGWTDCDDAELKAYIERTYQIANRARFDDAMHIVSHKNSFHPVIARLEALPPWDGKPRVCNLFPKYLGAEESDYTTEVTLLWMLGAISRVYNPGCKFDYVLILVGEQGVGKSTLLRLMSLEDGWFDDSIGAMSGKESWERLHGKWIIELQELKALKREKDAESIKAFITTQSDYYREPYARRAEDHPRQCVFVGTTNERFFLTDRTGNRRFIPLQVAGSAPEKLFTEECRVFIEQCWAEALAIFKGKGHGPTLKLSAEIAKSVAEKQKEHLEEDARVSLIQGWLDSTSEQYVAVIDIWTYALRKEGTPARKDSNEIHRIMKYDISGWQASSCKHRTRCSSGPTICYEREQNSGDGNDIS